MRHSFAPISSGLCLFFGISVSLAVQRHTSSLTTSVGEDQFQVITEGCRRPVLLHDPCDPTRDRREIGEGGKRRMPVLRRERQEVVGDRQQRANAQTGPNAQHDSRRARGEVVDQNDLS